MVAHEKNITVVSLHPSESGFNNVRETAAIGMREMPNKNCTSTEKLT